MLQITSKPQAQFHYTTTYDYNHSKHTSVSIQLKYQCECEHLLSLNPGFFFFGGGKHSLFDLAGVHPTSNMVNLLGIWLKLLFISAYEPSESVK